MINRQTDLSNCRTNSSLQRSNTSTRSRHKKLFAYDLVPSNFTNINFQIVRYLSVSPHLYDKEPLKPSSKVEETVQRLKDKKIDLQNAVAVEGEKKVVAKPNIGQRIWAELVHYYHGFRLLFIDMRVSTGLVMRILNGKTLSRREHNLLIRTVGDMFRLLPFSVFIVVPFMELMLPFYLKFFPGMLPSTFQTEHQRQEGLRATLKAKLEMAKFLQSTLDEMATQNIVGRNSKSAKEFSEWFQKVRSSGDQVTNEEIMKFSKLFRDELTLDSLSRGQLIALCRVLEVQTLGTNNLLRFQLRMKLRSLKADDKLIQKEGVDSLNIYELQQACRARGMRAYGMSEPLLKQQLIQWLDLSLNQKVPPSLLLMSRALMLPEKIPTTDKLKATISVLPDTVVQKTKAAIAETEGKVDNKLKIQILKEEMRKVTEEREEHREEMKRQEERIIDKAPIIESRESELIRECNTDDRKKPQISTKDLGVLEDAIDTLAKDKKKLIIEKEKIEDLKEEMADYCEDIKELKCITEEINVPHVVETKAAKRLYKKVNKMIVNLDCVVQQLESKEKKIKQHIAARAAGETKTTEEELVRIDELLSAIKKLQKVPEDSLKHIQNILAKMDDDHDGSVKVDEVLKVSIASLWQRIFL